MFGVWPFPKLHTAEVFLTDAKTKDSFSQYLPDCKQLSLCCYIWDGKSKGNIWNVNSKEINIRNNVSRINILQLSFKTNDNLAFIGFFLKCSFLASSQIIYMDLMDLRSSILIMLLSRRPGSCCYEPMCSIWL